MKDFENFFVAAVSRPKTQNYILAISRPY